MNYPEYVEVNGKQYKINTDFRIAIECNEIAMDNEISDYERALAIIYKLFGEEALNDFNNHKKLLELGQKYLACGMEMPKNKKQEEPDMDYIQDEGFIKSSFKYDYKYDPYQLEYLHFWDFFNDLNNLSNDEFGTCCVLSRIRNLRNRKLKDIKDPKEKQRVKEAQEIFALKKRNKKNYTQEEINNINDFLKQVNIRKE